MAKITGYSRLLQHTLTTAGLTFSVPPSEDFTDGTWNTNGTQLCLSELGVNEADSKAYIRIGSNIKELQFAGGASSASLSDVMLIGNTTGTSSLILGSGARINSVDNMVVLEGVPTSVLSVGESIQITTSSDVNISAGSTVSTITLDTYASSLYILPNGNIEINSGENTIIRPWNADASINIGGDNTFAYTSNGGLIFKKAELQTTDDTPTIIASIPLIEGQVVVCELMISGRDSTGVYSGGGSGTILGMYEVGGSPVFDINTNLLLNSGPTLDFWASAGASSIDITVTGEAAVTWNWNINYRYSIQTTL